MSPPSRRSVLASLGVGAAGAGGYAAMRYATRWTPDPEDCTVDSRSHTADAPVSGSFPHPRADARMAGHAPEGTVASSGSGGGSSAGSEYWRTDVGSSPSPYGVGELVAPVVAGEYCYVSGRRLYALDRRDGRLAWCVDPGPQALTAPAVSDGTVVVGARFAVGRSWRGIAAFDAETGDRLWRAPSRQWFKPTVGLPRTAPTVHDGSVYVAGGTGTGRVTALDLDTGAVEWQTGRVDTGSETTSAAVSGDGVFVLLGGRLARLDAESGDLVWGYDAGETTCPPVVADGTVYAPRRDGALGAWVATDGARRWSADRLRGSPSSLAVADGTCYVVSDWSVTALDARDGATVWNRTRADLERTLGVDSPDALPPRHCTVTDDRVYLSAGERIVALDPAGGEVEWHVTFPWEDRGDARVSGTPGVPAVAGGVAYCYTETGTVYALDA